jgi:ribulose 1,5-bisphosphate synthetase/thiazole synthase
MNLWSDTLLYVEESRPALDGAIDTDIAIVGGGFTGLWSAYYLKPVSYTHLRAHET